MYKYNPYPIYSLCTNICGIPLPDSIITMHNHSMHASLYYSNGRL